ncbi:MAG TPA: hypothetical protein PL044_00910 [Clostridiales bacterium]|mgnify:CR=1 FL=1|nr:MAG: hypothetical protein BWY37_00763 [Firmicutes bacterium ADurb.Bin262]HQH62959.1 hypothetical protein [Clostridiales bacterium]HQK72328.1 hypothetical protein [Clostridiales bacterium]
MGEQCGCGFNPVIIVPGIGDCKAYEADGQGKRLRSAWPPDIDAAAMKKLKKKLALPALRMLLLRHDLGFSKKAGEALAEALDVMASNPDGTYKHNIRVETYDAPLSELSEAEQKFIYRMLPLRPLADIIGADHLFYFGFVAIGNTEDTVERLRAFVKYVKEKTGHGKVNLAAVSLGGTITTAYLDAYAHEGDIGRVVGVVPAFDGSAIISDIMKKNVAFDDYETLFNELLGKKKAEQILKVTRLIPKKVLRNFVEAVLETVATAVVGNSTTMWGLIPSGEYEALSKRYLAGPEKALIKAQADKAWRVRCDFPALVRKARENGIDMYSLCGYDVRLLKIVNSDKISSDMIVHSESESLGARIAPPGETLGEGYTQANLNCQNPAHNHLSPDNKVDASCGALPDTTWYWSGMEHEEAAVNKPLLELMGLLLSGQGPADVFADPAYPQFSVFVKPEKK